VHYSITKKTRIYFIFLGGQWFIESQSRISDSQKKHWSQWYLKISTSKLALKKKVQTEKDILNSLQTISKIA